MSVSREHAPINWGFWEVGIDFGEIRRHIEPFPARGLAVKLADERHLANIAGRFFHGHKLNAEEHQIMADDPDLGYYFEFDN